MEIRDNQVFLGGVPASELAAQYGTPLYVIEEDTLRRQYRSIVETVPYRPLRIYYACKANWNVQVMRLLRSEGACVDVCSPGDIRLAQAAGYQSEQMIYTGYAVSNDELQLIADLGLALNVDSLSQLRRYAQLGGHGAIGLRVNTGIRAGFHTHVTSAVASSKFGLHPEQLETARDVAATHGLRIVGLHTHLGSDILDRTPFLAAIDALLSAADGFEHLQYIDLGGGLGVPFGPNDRPFDLVSYGHAIEKRLDEWSDAHGRSLHLYFEPGEYLVAESTSLLMRVVDVKPAVACGSEQTPSFVGTDSSFNHVFATAMYDAYHEVLVANRAAEPACERVCICGNLMQAGDVLAKDRLLPPLREGDLLVMANCGAYAMCRAPRFNGRPLPAEVMVKDGHSRLVRQRETVDDLLAHQVID